MTRALAGRLRPIPRREAAPLALLLLALSSVFVFGNDRSQFYREVHHDYVSAQTLAVAANLSAEHGFAGFYRRKLDPDGEPLLLVYHRFPIGSYALVGLAILPFGDDFPRAIHAARLLMLALFAAAAVLAYLALSRLLGDRRIALAATLLACSSYYLLYYNDMIAPEASTNFFGVMLVFHGTVVFGQEGRLRQLLAKTAVALLLGWHAAGLIAAFVPLALGRELVAARADGGGDRPTDDRRLRPRAILAYGAFSVLWCALLLGFNLVTEYRALGGEAAPHQLPSLQSALIRTGAVPIEFDWPAFLRGQLGGVGGLTIPFAAVDRLGLDLAFPLGGYWPPNPWFAAYGAAVFAACLAGLRFLPHRTPFAALLLAGWCWAIPFRGATAVHEFYALAHAGVALVFFALVLLGLRRIPGPRRAARALPAAAAAAIAVFALSAWDMSGVGHDAAAAGRQREAASDARAIRAVAGGGSIVVQLDAKAFEHKMIRNYYLAGSYLQLDPIRTEAQWRALPGYDFALLPADFGGSLTPRNRRIHLYPLAALPDVHASIAAREPSLRARFDLRLEGRTLTYARAPCAVGDAAAPFFLRVFPAGGAPPAEIAFEFAERGGVFDGKCLALVRLPEGPIAGIRTGQRPGGGLPPVWEASLPAGDPSFPRGASTWRETLGLAERALASVFDLHAGGRTLAYVREACSAADTGDRFFLHAYAADPGDLPAERRKAGFEALDFWFGDRGGRYDGTCVAFAELPDYELRSVRTGQYDGGGHLWDAEFALDAVEWLARFDALAAREPDARRAGFALHIEGRTLTLAREGCSAADVADRFFVHAHPAGGGERANLDFWFRQRGERHGDRCMASVVLPPWPAARVVAGQYDASGHLWKAMLPIGE